MDHKAFVDHYAVPCAIVSVEVTADARRGNMCFVSGNQAFRDSVMDNFQDGMACDELFKGDANFQDLCVRSAIMGRQAHSYAYSDARDQWLELTFLPLVREREDLGLCLLMVEATDRPEPERMAAVSMDTAAAAVQASVTLLAADDLKESVNQVLSDIVDRSGGFSCVLILVDHELHQTRNYGEAFVRGAFGDTLLTAAITPYETTLNWQRMLGDNGELVVTSPEGFDAIEHYDPAWVSTLRMFGVSSIIICSLRQGADVFGFLLLSNFDVERLFEIKELMELMSFILSAEVSNHLLMAQLELMSTHDELTHLLNRHAMTRRIEEMTRDGDSVPFGIVSIDLNGLKETNDRYGHDAGDKIIVRAAQLLRKVFSVEGLYRIGGDEFMAIMLGVERSDFNESVGRLRAEAASEDVSLAIGAVFSDGSVDIEEAILQVDELMYADKAAFYEAHPDVRRR